MSPTQLENGRYVVSRKLGSGGTAEVYQATDTLLNRAVAIKVIHPRLSNDTMLRARIEAEYRVCRSLRDERIVELYDFKPDHSPQYLVMEYMPGGDLRRRLLDLGSLPATEVRRIARAVLRSLSVAHRAGIVHRDIKPRNILFTDGGEAKIADFGLAQSASSAGLSRSREIAGTPEYTAPETITAGVVDTRADLYSLGCSLYEALAGRPPFTANTPDEVIRRQVEVAAPALPAAVAASDPGLALLVMGLIEKDPNRRPQSADEAAEALEGDSAPEVALIPVGAEGGENCTRCGAPINPDYPWCFGCGKPQIPVSRSGRGRTILITGPGRRGEKASPEIRDACCEVGESARLDVEHLRQRIPRYPFVFAHKVEEAGAERLTGELTSRGVTAVISGTETTTLRAVTRKSFTMAPRIYLVILGTSGGMINLLGRWPGPVTLSILGGLLLAVPAALGLAYSRSNARWSAGPRRGISGDVGRLVASSTDPLIHARMAAIAASIAAVRSAADRHGAEKEELAAIEAECRQVLERSAGLCLAMETARSGSSLLDGSTAIGDLSSGADVSDSVEFVRSFETVYTRTLMLLSTSALRLRELTLSIVRAEIAEARGVSRDIRSVAEELGDQSAAWGELNRFIETGRSV